MKIALLCLLSICLSAASIAQETVIHLGKFSSGDLIGWEEQTLGILKKKTTYGFSKDGEATALVAHSSKAASGLIYKLKLDPREFTTLKWSWKIDHTMAKGDERTKEGDDFSVRVYALFPRGFFSETRAICYVWSNKLAKGEHVVSPFTKNVVTVAEDSGNELAGHWTFHQRNIYQDYKKFFGEEPQKLGAIALMTDTDNTGETAVGYYGDISLIRPTRIDEARPKEHKPKEANPRITEPKDFRPKEQQQTEKAILPPVLPASPAPVPPAIK